MSGAQEIALVITGGLLAAAVGSFVCVIIDRMPLALEQPNEFGDLYDTRPWKEVLGGTSRCSTCATPVRPYDNVPVVSWLLLRGRCRSCGARIPFFHEMVELAVPALALLLYFRLGWDWRLLPVLWLVPVGVAASVIDFRTFIVPTRIVWPAFGVSVVLSVIAALVSHHPRWLLGAVIGVAALAGTLFALWFALPSGMGFGDVRLAVLLGWTTGFTAIRDEWTRPLLVGFAVLGLSAMIGIVFSIVGLTARGRKAKVPFGPALFLGSLICIAFASAT